MTAINATGTPSIPTTSSSLTLANGLTSAGSNQFFSGIIHEVMMFSGELNDHAIRRLEGYLAHGNGVDRLQLGQMVIHTNLTDLSLVGLNPLLWLIPMFQLTLRIIFHSCRFSIVLSFWKVLSPPQDFLWFTPPIMLPF